MEALRLEKIFEITENTLKCLHSEPSYVFSVVFDWPSFYRTLYKLFLSKGNKQIGHSPSGD